MSKNNIPHFNKAVTNKLCVKQIKKYIVERNCFAKRFGGKWMDGVDTEGVPIYVPITIMAFMTGLPY